MPKHAHASLVFFRRLWLGLGLLALLCGLPVRADVFVDTAPLSKPNTVPGNLVLMPSVEWPTVNTQANDPGVAESSAAYAPATAYAGYFNVDLCYAYNYDATEANRYFYPVSAVNSGGNHSCSGQTGGTPTQRLWSGNFLNWTSMQAIDTFRLALTGGYRVHRPIEGTPPSVTIVGADGTSVTKSTSEMPDVTYLEKASSDRWTDSYTKLRRLTGASNATPADATPSQASVSSSNPLRTRIGGLRNQMWFIPYSTGSELGTGGSCCTTSDELSLPVADGTQTDHDNVSALPYNPTYHTLPNANTTTTTNSTACGVNETGCSTATPLCDTASGFSWNGSQCVKSTTTTTTSGPNSVDVEACPDSTYPYFKLASTAKNSTCRKSSSSSSSTPHSCGTAGTTVSGSTTTTISIVFPTSSGNNAKCTVTTTVNTTTTTTTVGVATPQYQHTIYGRNQIYALSVRAKVCDGALDTRSLCTKYGSNYKPEGLLQKNARKIRYSLFSYLVETGSVRAGGVMRARQKLIGPVVSGEKPYPDKAGRIADIDNPEWDAATGVFIDNPDATDTSATNSNIGNCASSAPDGSQCVVKYSGVINYLNRFGQMLTGQAALKGSDNLSEMYYTALRYLRGLANISTNSSLDKKSGSDLAGGLGTALVKYQNADGMPVIENWFKTGANTAVTAWNSTSPARTTGTDGDPILYQCQTTVVLGIGDTATQSEGDADSSDNGVPMSTWRNYLDAGNSTNVRLATSALAFWAHLNDIRSDVPNTEVANKTQGSKRGQTISTYWVDVVELNDLKSKTDNQYYNATKYGGYNIPIDDWGSDGNATRRDATWLNNNRAAWSSATQTVKVATALGGTGDFYLPDNMYLANNGQKMIDGLTSAFSKIVQDLAGSGASLAANSTKLDTGTTTYQAVYYTGDWRGDIKAFAVSNAGIISTTATWEASKVLPTPSARNIVTCTGSGTCTTSVAFSTTTTFDAKNSLCANPASCGSGEADTLINYLRGNNVSTLRLRSSALGDIVNSQPVFSGAPSPNLHNGRSFAAAYRTFANSTDVKTRKKMIYVAANDGMVHAFSAEPASFSATINSVSTTVQPGQEVFAYLPKAVIKSGLRKISAADYGDTTNPHQFWNDGELVVADVECATACPNAVGGWATVLVGTTGRGPSKAVYALDVTDPTDIRLLWERSSSDGATGSDYIGQVVGKPVIARVSSTGSWAVLMGNGYNSTQNVPALLQFDIADGALSVYTTGGSTDDGLAPPAVWIKDANINSNVSSEAYAGDLNGNVWAFTLSSSGGGSGSKIFIAKDGNGSGAKLQPITAGMVVAKNPVDNQVWVFFGTGSFLSSFKTTDGLQTWYGLIAQGADKVSCTSASSCTLRSGLRQRTIVAESASTSTSLAARAISASAAGDMVGSKGWFIDLKLNGGTEKGERMITPNQFYGYLLVGTSRLPTTGDPCNPSGSGWVMAIYPFTGAPPSTAFFDINSNGVFTDDRVIAPDGTSYVAAGVGFGAIPNNPIFVGHTMMLSFDNATTGSLNVRPTGDAAAARLSWRELVGQ